MLKYFLTLYFGVLSLHIYADTVTPSERVVNGVIVRQEANSYSAKVGELLPNSEATLIESYPRYHKVKLSNGKIGFVSKSWVSVYREKVEERLKIHFLDVGQGDSTLINCPNGNNILIDMGTSNYDLNNNPRIIKDYLKSALVGNGIIQTLVVTHPDRSHYSLIPKLLDAYSLENIVFVGNNSEYQFLSSEEENMDLREWIDKKGANATRLTSNDFDSEDKPNEIINCGEASIFILAAGTQAVESQLKNNTSSIVLMLRYKNFSAVFPSDATTHVENKILSRFDIDWLDVDVLKLSHHGSTTNSNSAEWLSILNPSIAIASSGLNNKYGHPRANILERLRNLKQVENHDVAFGEWRPDKRFFSTIISNTKSSFYTTATNGNVVVFTDGFNNNVKLDFKFKDVLEQQTIEKLAQKISQEEMSGVTTLNRIEKADLSNEEKIEAIEGFLKIAVGQDVSLGSLGLSMTEIRLLLLDSSGDDLLRSYDMCATEQCKKQLAQKLTSKIKSKLIESFIERQTNLKLEEIALASTENQKLLSEELIKKQSEKLNKNKVIAKRIDVLKEFLKDLVPNPVNFSAPDQVSSDRIGAVNYRFKFNSIPDRYSFDAVEEFKEAIKPTDKIKASLKGQGVDIFEINDSQKHFAFDEEFHWQWELKPSGFDGTQNIYLSLDLIVDIEGYVYEKQLQNHTHKLEIKVTYIEKLLGFLSEYWQWLFTVIILPLFLYFKTRYSKEKKERNLRVKL